MRLWHVLPVVVTAVAFFQGAVRGQQGQPSAKAAGSAQVVNQASSAKESAGAKKAETSSDRPAGQDGQKAASASASTSPGAGTTNPTAEASSGREESGSRPASDQQASSKPESAVPASAGSASLDGATYQVRMRDLAQRIDELKEQIRRSHTRLSLLSDTILSGGAGGARAEIVFTNEMSSAFRLVRALFMLDGVVQYNRQDETGALAEQKSIPIFSGSIPPGDHTLQVLIKLQGHGYGVFSYLRGYKFEVKSTRSFTVSEGKTIRLEVVAWEKGGVTTPLEQRPAIRYVERVGSVGSGGSASSVPTKARANKLEAGFSAATGAR